MQLWTQFQQQCDTALARLSVRERVMVMVSVVFVTITLLGSALWSMHQAAEREQQRVNELKDQMVWMQSHAVTMKAAQDQQLSASEKIQRLGQQQGLSLSVSQQGEQIQIVVMHAEYAVLANLLTQMAKDGLNLKKIQLLEEGQTLKLTALVA
ncbi:type II secretion system protein GspM [uncultured Acinetobacter sp.]|uniref:type II secretion system protein GspM n=1 Tax=uncultured Acinetobacter sp. TaxID=165433 RepID=UPI0026102582|nr:type II secretion system protein GspM [uncultured Acinetobacter sp.]